MTPRFQARGTPSSYLTRSGWERSAQGLVLGRGLWAQSSKLTGLGMSTWPGSRPRDKGDGAGCKTFLSPVGLLQVRPFTWGQCPCVWLRGRGGGEKQDWSWWPCPQQKAIRGVQGPLCGCMEAGRVGLGPPEGLHWARGFGVQFSHLGGGAQGLARPGVV